MEHRPELDGIRAFAVLAVLAFHAGLKPATGGWLGVDVFFVLSGYLITLILLREHDRKGQVSLRDFWVRRLLRLVPALLVIVVLGAFFFSTLGDRGTFVGYLRTAGSAGLYIENFVWAFTDNQHGQLAHTWSLAVEMQFYLIWPALLVWLLARGRKLTPWLLAGIAISYVLFVLEAGGAPHGAVAFSDSYYLPWTRAFELLLGALVAVRLRERKADRPEATGGLWAGWLLLVGFGVLLIGAWDYPIFTRPSAIIWQSAGAALLTSGLLIHLDRVRASGVGRLFAWRPVAWVGLISYGVYLVHYPVIAILRDRAGIHDAKTMLVIAVPLTLAIAATSYYLVERPALRLKPLFSRPLPSLSLQSQPID